MSLNTEDVRRGGGGVSRLCLPESLRVKTKLHGGAADDDDVWI